MKKEHDFLELKEYLYLIYIESYVKIGTYKLPDAKKLLKSLQFEDKLIDPFWEILNLEDEKFLSYSIRVGTYINHKKKALVVALSGTKNGQDIKPDFEILRGRIPSRFIKLNDYLNIHLSNNIRQLYTKAGYKIIFTGHSLGGFLAQLAYVKYKFENPSFLANVIVFDSPGAKKQALELLTQNYVLNNYNLSEANKLAENELRKFSYKENIVNVIRRFNVINTSGQNIGSYLLIAENYLKPEHLNKLKLWTNLSFHRLNAFIESFETLNIYNFYKLTKPLYSTPILLKSAQFSTECILLSIKQLQQQNLSENVYNEYLKNILNQYIKIKDCYNADTNIFNSKQPELQLWKLEKMLNDKFKFVDRSKLLTKIIDFFQLLRGKKSSVDLQQDNIYILDKLIQDLKVSQITSSNFTFNNSKIPCTTLETFNKRFS